MTDPVLVWLRQDLRLRDQPAFREAAGAGPVIPVYVLDDATPGDWRIGGAQRWWLHGSLSSLAHDLEAKGSRLILRRGRASAVLKALVRETGAGAIHAIRHYEPWWRAEEEALGDLLTLHDGNHLAPPDAVTSGAGKPYRIYSAFWRALQDKLPPEKPRPAPRTLDTPAHWPKSETLADWDLLPTTPDWAKAFGDDWAPGEKAAAAKLRRFAPKVGTYEDDRNAPSIEGTSRLSPHLHHGEISPAAVYHATASHAHVETFHSELAWRDFTSNLVAQFPDYADANGRAKFDKLHWRTGNAARRELRAWQKGRTGYPIVDAGMRQLWQTGWMHNRVRMITASFLTKHLLLDWRDGEKWFWDCLVDADYGNNAVNWQWVSGTGVDASLFSRIMAPLTQSEKFDAADYIRRWVPELADLSDEAIHDPDEAGCRPDDYPAKIIGHREARERALDAFRAL